MRISRTFIRNSSILEGFWFCRGLSERVLVKMKSVLRDARSESFVDGFRGGSGPFKTRRRPRGLRAVRRLLAGGRLSIAHPLPRWEPALCREQPLSGWNRSNATCPTGGCPRRAAGLQPAASSWTFRFGQPANTGFRMAVC